MNYLHSIIFRLPISENEFNTKLVSLFHNLSGNPGGKIFFPPSDPSFFPQIYLDLQSSSKDVFATFCLSNRDEFSVKIENITTISVQSPPPYQHLPIDKVVQRFQQYGIKIIGIDHIGFNLPWSNGGLHPHIIQLREILASQCLYHRFPTGEAWDFILPGDIEEITGRKNIDYAKQRKPKFEFVTFRNASKPLIQFDLAVNIPYKDFSPLFPEALDDPSLCNSWIYLQNPHLVDICLVLNEYKEHDWSDFFEGYRI